VRDSKNAPKYETRWLSSRKCMAFDPVFELHLKHSTKSLCKKVSIFVVSCELASFATVVYVYILTRNMGMSIYFVGILIDSKRFS